jgi:uncharacterized protein YecE (DUF72 family)
VAAARATVWCVYDNTASGAAAADALRTIEALAAGRPRARAAHGP